MDFKIKEIAQILNLKPDTALEDCLIEYLLHDSRQIINPETSLFFAIKTKKNDGHLYIDDLIKKGVKCFVVSELPEREYSQVQFFLQNDVIFSLQKIAKAHRDNFDIPIIAISGSNGKTIVKEWLAQLISTHFKVVKSPKSYNSQIGVPISISQIRTEDEIGIFEAGISTTREMEFLEEIISPSIGIYTNIGSAHAEGFNDLNEKLQEKAKLFQNCELTIYCKDQELVHNYFRQSSLKTLSWSMHGQADLQVKAITKQDRFSRLEFTYKALDLQLEIPFTDSSSIENLLHCILAALHLKIPIAKIQKEVSKLGSIEMRLELLEGENRCTIINDSYNADLESLTAAMQFMDEQKLQAKRILILSDFSQIQTSGEIFYSKVSKIISQFPIDVIVGIGDKIVQIDNFLDSSIKRYYYTNTESFLKTHPLKDFWHSLVLVKGARNFTFEKIVQVLVKKQHQASLEVNLSAASQNFDFFKNSVSSDTMILCMVKAAGYGTGGVEIAKMIENKKPDYFGVAYVDEGVALRKARIKTPILVLNVDPTGFQKLFDYDLEPEIYSLKQLSQLISMIPGNDIIRIHLKLDTGMHRLGFEEKNLNKLINILQKERRVKVQSILSHLAASEDPNEDQFSTEQAQLFEKLSRRISKELDIQPFRHLVNSAGILRFPQFHYEMVRLGIGLYGINPTDRKENRLEPVMSLRAKISQIKELNKGETVGYSRAGQVKSKTKIAIINIGYADGLLRKAGNGNFFILINGQKAHTIGNICMDMSILDITKIDNVQEGDEVEIFGKENSVEHLSKVLDTIPYEVYTSISERVKRIYYQE